MCVIGTLTPTWPKTNKATVYCSPVASKYKGERNKPLQFYSSYIAKAVFLYPLCLAFTSGGISFLSQFYSKIEKKIEQGRKWNTTTWITLAQLEGFTWLCYLLCFVATNVVSASFWLGQRLQLRSHFPTVDKPSNPQRDGEDRGERVCVIRNALRLPREGPPLRGPPLEEK